MRWSTHLGNYFIIFNNTTGLGRKQLRFEVDFHDVDSVTLSGAGSRRRKLVMGTLGCLADVDVVISIR